MARIKTDNRKIQPILKPRLSLSDYGEVSTNMKTLKQARAKLGSSEYKGVNLHQVTKRFEARFWDTGYVNPENQRKGKLVFLGGYANEKSAAKAYDLAALKYLGKKAQTNFHPGEYEKEIKEMANYSRHEYVNKLRSESNPYGRGASDIPYGKGASDIRGVSRSNDRWQARIGKAQKTAVYLGTFDTQEEAAIAFDVAALKYKGIRAATNYELGNYDVEKIRGMDTNDENNIIKNPQQYLRPESNLMSSNIVNGEDNHGEGEAKSQENGDTEMLDGDIQQNEQLASTSISPISPPLSLLNTLPPPSLQILHPLMSWYNGVPMVAYPFLP